ncbi:hypothetical protein B0H19DRAFT_1188802 [Mycena capillaripes]|nr:hypothetical protein B0H19DRAFT_1188802 [Mycena capillaripes]
MRYPLLVRFVSCPATRRPRVLVGRKSGLVLRASSRRPPVYRLICANSSPSTLLRRAFGYKLCRSPRLCLLSIADILVLNCRVTPGSDAHCASFKLVSLSVALPSSCFDFRHRPNMAFSGPQPSRILVVPPASASKPIPRRLTSPITPATTAGVTGIIFPSPLESSPSEPLPAARHRPLRQMSRIDSVASTSHRSFVEISSDVPAPPQLDDATALDDLWNSLRLEKGLKMDKERPKVKSLEDYKPTTVLSDILKPPSPRPASRLTISDAKPPRQSPPASVPSARAPERRSLLEDVLSNDRSSTDRDSFFRSPSPARAKMPRPSPSPSPTPAKMPSPAKSPALKKKKSITLFRTLPEKNYMVAIFDLRGVDKEDIRVTFRRDHIMVSWEKWEVENWEEEECIARRTVERVYHRVIPLAEGTKFRDIYGTMKGEDLLLRYPLVGINGSRSGES